MIASTDGVLPAYLVKGSDPTLVAQSARSLLDRLVGERDVNLVIEEMGGPGADELDVGAVIDACTSPAFLVDRRVVVVRDAGRLTAADATRLVAYLDDALESTVLVLVSGAGTVPQSLTKAIGKAGEVLDTSVGTGRARTQWLVERLHDAPVRLENAAALQLGEHLGDDLGRLEGILETLATAYGPGERVSLGQLEPFLGEAGGLPPWELTGPIDQGDIPGALGALTRMLAGGRTHALVVLTMLHRHYQSMLRLDGVRVRSADEAAELLGSKSAFTAKKALEQGRRLGSERLAQAVHLLAVADLDVRGMTAMPPETVLEILIARLARLARSR